MEFDQVLSLRHSTRTFKPDIVDESLLESIIETANMAPSAGNLQSYEIYVVRPGEKLEELERAAWDQESIGQSQACLVFCANPEKSAAEYGKRGRELYCIQDATIAATFALLKIFDLGLSTVWIGAFDEKEVKNIVGSGINRPVVIMPVGYAGEEPPQTSRAGLDDLVHYVK